MDTTDKSSVLGPRDAMMAWLLQIHDDGEGQGIDEGAMIVASKGYISGIPEFFQTIAMTLSGSKTESRRNPLLRVCGRITKPASA
jgi:hypothetical protein